MPGGQLQKSPGVLTAVVCGMENTILLRLLDLLGFAALVKERRSVRTSGHKGPLLSVA